ncbi:MAG: LptF/LptG family permease [Alphaproteobacteria bacterium]|nr:LptF/LptG family permease [Alphaproteobacteria bacterium]
MRPGTFPLYVVRRLLAQLFLILLVLTIFAFLVDCVELLRRAAALTEPGFADALVTALMRLPAQALRLLPLALILAAALVASHFARQSELAVARAAGLPIRCFLASFAIAGFALGLLALGLQAMAANGLARIEGRTGEPAAGETIWLEERQGEGRLIVHGRIEGRDPLRLREALLLRFDDGGELSARIDAERAQLADGAWILSGTTVWEGGARATRAAHLEEPTALEEHAILRPVRAPSSIAFWSIGREIVELRAIGRPAGRHELALHGWLAMPVLLAALALVAGAGSLRLPLRASPAQAIIFGIGLGFLLFIVAELASAFGGAGAIPPALAAWIPAGVASLAALSCLAFVEDG